MLQLILLTQKGPLINWNEVSTRTYDTAEECIKVNYKGARKMVDTFLLLLQLSDSPRIVNVSSMTGVLKVELEKRLGYVLLLCLIFIKCHREGIFSFFYPNLPKNKSNLLPALPPHVVCVSF